MIGRIKPLAGVRWLTSIMVVAAALTLSALAPPAQTPAGLIDGACRVTESVTDRPPDDPHSSSFASPGGTWYANSDRSIWAWWWGQTSGGSYKVLWIRPAGSTLKVTGRRLDGAAPPLTAHIPSGYFHTFQASGLSFSAPGCWQVDASADRRALRFVVKMP